MRIDRDWMVFGSHRSWWYFDKKTLLIVPTNEAPPEAVEAIERYNSNDN